MFCSNCGQKNNEGVNFCSSCGNDLHSSLESGVKRVSVNDQHESGANKSTPNNNLFAILGWISAVISLLFIPILFAAGGVILGYLHKKHNNTHGTIIMIASVALGLLGVMLGIASIGY